MAAPMANTAALELLDINIAADDRPEQLREPNIGPRGNGLPSGKLYQLSLITAGLGIVHLNLLTSFLSSGVKHPPDTPCVVMPSVSERFFLRVGASTIAAAGLIVVLFCAQPFLQSFDQRGRRGRSWHTPLAALVVVSILWIVGWHLGYIVMDFNLRFGKLGELLQALEKLLFWGAHACQVFYTKELFNRFGQRWWAAVTLTAGLAVLSQAGVVVLMARGHAMAPVLGFVVPLLLVCAQAGCLACCSRAQLENTMFGMQCRQIAIGMSVAMYSNVADAVEGAVSYRRGTSPGMFDVEIKVFQLVVQKMVPLLTLVLCTPDWRQVSARDQGSLYSSLIRKVLKVFMWFGFWQFMLWGVHMSSCYPADPKKAKDGGAPFVVARGAAATFYFDLPLLLLTVLPGVMSLFKHWFGAGLPSVEDSAGHILLHKVIGIRFVLMVAAHSLAHIYWLQKDGLHEYLGRIWGGSVLAYEVPLVTGILMAWPAALALPVYWSWKKTRFSWFRTFKVLATALTAGLAVLHGLSGGLGNPRLFAFIFLTSAYGGLDAYIMRWCRESYLVTARHFWTTNVDGSVLVVQLGSDTRAAQLGYVYLAIRTVAGVHPFTIVPKTDGSRELHISLKTRELPDGYVNWATHVLRFLTSLDSPLRFRIDLAGPFCGGPLCNRTLLESYNWVALLMLGTGSAGGLQALRVLWDIHGHNLNAHVRMVVRSKVPAYRNHLADICAGFGVQHLEFHHDGGHDQFWEQAALTIDGLVPDTDVLVAVCGPQEAVTRARRAFADFDVVGEGYE